MESRSTGFRPMRDQDAPAMEDDEERAHFRKCLGQFLTYREFARAWIYRVTENFARLPRAHRNCIEGIPSLLRKLQRSTQANADFLERIASPHVSADGVGLFDNVHPVQIEQQKLDISRFDMREMEKIRSTLKQFVREWSAEGAQERECTLGVLLRELTREFPEASERKGRRVLIPGAGLGRLVLEVAQLGFEAQGNEFSLYMLFAADLVLNRMAAGDTMEIFPFVHATTNSRSWDTQCRAITVPDVHASATELAEGGSLSMCAGEFVEVYRDQVNEWDCMLCSFFLDTAENICSYLEVAQRVLKHGGILISFGPLLFHYADMLDHPSIEIPLDVFRGLFHKFGFIIEKEEEMRVPYCNDRHSMLHIEYDAVLFVARRQAIPQS